MNDPASRQVDLVGRAMHGAGLVGLCAILAALYVFCYQPLVVQRREHATESQRLRKQLEHAEATFANRDRLTLQYEQLSERIASARRRIPSSDGEAEFLEFATRTAQTAGVDLVDFRRRDIQHMPGYSQLRTAIHCRGSYPGLCQFLQSVTQAERLVTVDNLDITADFQDGRHTATLVLILYFGLGESQVSAAAPSSGGNPT